MDRLKEVQRDYGWSLTAVKRCAAMNYGPDKTFHFRDSYKKFDLYADAEAWLVDGVERVGQYDPFRSE